MSITTRQAALDALTWEDAFEACVALSMHIKHLKQFLADGDDVELWQKRLQKAEVAHQRLTDIHVAS